MARLTRKNIKVFAGNANNNGVFGSLQANNPTLTNDVEQLQSLPAWGNGWNDATETSEELPPLEEIQGVEYVTTYQQAYIMQEGLPEWAASVTYYKGCLVKEVTTNGFRIYNSLANNNTGNSLTDTTKWKKVMDSEDLYAYDSAVVHKTGNESISGTKTFSTTPIVQTMTTTDSSTKAASTAYVQNNLTGAVETIKTANLATNKVVITDGNGKIDDSNISTNELGCLAGVSSNIQDQLNGTVKTTGNQTIAGTKTFTSDLIVENNGADLNLDDTDYTKGQRPASNQDSCVRFRDSAKSNLGILLHRVEKPATDDDPIMSYIRIQNNKPSSESSAVAYLAIDYKSNGDHYMNFNTLQKDTGDTNLSLSKATNSTSDSYIPCMGWVNNPNCSTNVVHRSGTEQIAGTKNFTSSPTVPTPAAGDNSTKVATTAFINNSKATIVGWGMPKYSSAVSITTGYSATSAGYIYITQNLGNVVTTVVVDNVTILTMRGHSGSSHGQPRVCATVIIGKGSTITFANATALFVPCTGV